MKIKILYIFFILVFSIITFANISIIIKRINPSITESRLNLIINTVDNLSDKLHIDKNIIYAMIWQESNFYNLNIHYDINGNSIGYLQIHKNAFDYVKMLNPKFRKYNYNDLIYFPRINIEIGIYYLYYIYKYWKLSKHDIWYAISLYNGNKIKYNKYEKEIHDKYKYLVSEVF